MAQDPLPQYPVQTQAPVQAPRPQIQTQTHSNGRSQKKPSPVQNAHVQKSKKAPKSRSPKSRQNQNPQAQVHIQDTLNQRQTQPGQVQAPIQPRPSIQIQDAMPRVQNGPTQGAPSRPRHNGHVQSQNATPRVQNGPVQGAPSQSHPRRLREVHPFIQTRRVSQSQQNPENPQVDATQTQSCQTPQVQGQPQQNPQVHDQMQPRQTPQVHTTQPRPGIQVLNNGPIHPPQVQPQIQNGYTPPVQNGHGQGSQLPPRQNAMPTPRVQNGPAQGTQSQPRQSGPVQGAPSQSHPRRLREVHPFIQTRRVSPVQDQSQQNPQVDASQPQNSQINAVQPRQTPQVHAMQSRQNAPVQNPQPQNTQVHGQMQQNSQVNAVQQNVPAQGPRSQVQPMQPSQTPVQGPQTFPSHFETDNEGHLNEHMAAQFFYRMIMFKMLPMPGTIIGKPEAARMFNGLVQVGRVDVAALLSNVKFMEPFGFPVSSPSRRAAPSAPALATAPAPAPAPAQPSSSCGAQDTGAASVQPPGPSSAELDRIPSPFGVEGSVAASSPSPDGIKHAVLDFEASLGSWDAFQDPNTAPSEVMGDYLDGVVLDSPLFGMFPTLPCPLALSLALHPVKNG